MLWMELVGSVRSADRGASCVLSREGSARRAVESEASSSSRVEVGPESGSNPSATEHTKVDQMGNKLAGESRPHQPSQRLR